MHHPRDESRERWEQELRDRQRNVVFPDTVRNEGEFYRRVFSGGTNLNRWQTAGALIVLVFSVGVAVFLLVMECTGGGWPCIVQQIVLVSVIGACLLLMARHIVKSAKRAKEERQNPPHQ